MTGETIVRFHDIPYHKVKEGLQVDPKVPKVVGMGIDPGVKGALVLTDFAGDVKCSKMPDTPRGVVELIQQWKKDYVIGLCLLEKVREIPAKRNEEGEIEQGMSSTAMFTFGKGYGVLLASLIAAGIPFEEILPKNWQRGIGISPRKVKPQKRHRIPGVEYEEETKRQFKHRLRDLAMQLYRGRHNSINLENADAHLLAKLAVRFMK